MKLINKYWSSFAGIASIGIIMTLLFNGKPLLHMQSLVWFHFAILLFHQFEEYVFPGKFKEFFNTHIWNKNPIMKFPLNDKGVLIVNIILAWTAYFIAAIYGEKLIWLTIGLAGVTILNGIMHTFMFFALRKYNPGLVTGLLLFIPFGVFLLSSIPEEPELKNLVAGIMVFVIGTALIPVSIRLTNGKK